jgi:hypothetical protein
MSLIGFGVLHWASNTGHVSEAKLRRRAARLNDCPSGVIALFMAGRSINGVSNGQPQFIGYVGVQILLSDYGRRFTPDASP